MGNSRYCSDFISFLFLNLDLIQDLWSSCVWISKEMSWDLGQIAHSRASLLKHWPPRNPCAISFCTASPHPSLLPLLMLLMRVWESTFWALCLFLPLCCCLLIYSGQVRSHLIYVNRSLKTSWAGWTRWSWQPADDSRTEGWTEQGHWWTADPRRADPGVPGMARARTNSWCFPHCHGSCLSTDSVPPLAAATFSQKG